MIGVVITDASDQVVSQVVLEMTSVALSSWSTYSLSELTESLLPDIVLTDEEISAEEFDLPFLMVNREAVVHVCIAKAKGRRAIEFLVGTAREVLASPDLDVCALKEFRRREYMGHQVDLGWYGDNLAEMVNLAEWTIWTGLPDPAEVGYKQLVLAKSADKLDEIYSRFRSVVEKFTLYGLDPTSTKKAGAAVGIDFVDVREEFLRAAEDQDNQF
jgi:hypothetical protein